MASRERITIAQAVTAGLFVHDEHLRMLDVATAGEVAQEAAQRLLRAGRLPWWPASLEAGSIASVPDPWEALAVSPDDLVLMRVQMPEMGRYYHRQRVILLRTGLSPVEERATLWHELVHAERGDHRLANPDENAAMEASCDRLAARRALPVAALVEASATVRPSLEATAAALLTTPRLLEVRMNNLTAAEARRLDRRVAA